MILRRDGESMRLSGWDAPAGVVDGHNAEAFLHGVAELLSVKILQGQGPWHDLADQMARLASLAKRYGPLVVTEDP